MKKRTLFAAVLALSLLAGACSSSGSDGIVVDDPWGRSSPMVANGAFYMTIEGSDVDDRLVAAYASVCGATELHQTIMTDGVMSMQHAQDGIEIPAGGEAVLAPGGYHVMCINKDIEFKVGDVIPLTLTFETAEMQTVDAEIREG